MHSLILGGQVAVGACKAMRREGGQNSPAEVVRISDEGCRAGDRTGQDTTVRNGLAVEHAE